MLLTAIADMSAEHPSMVAYYEHRADLDENLLQILVDLGRKATVLIPYHRNSIPGEALGRPWHSSETETDLWGKRFSVQEVVDFQASLDIQFSGSAMEGLKELADKGWLRLSRTRSIAKCLQWRLTKQLRAKTLDDGEPDLDQFDLIQFFSQDKDIDAVYADYSRRLASGMKVPEVFEVIFASRNTLEFEKPALWANMTRVSFGGYIHRHDFMIPELSYVIPSGSELLANSHLHRPGSRRNILLSFYGSLHGRLNENFLEYERKKAMLSLASVQQQVLRFEKRPGGKSRHIKQLFDRLQASQVDKLFEAPCPELPTFEGLHRVGNFTKGSHHPMSQWDSMQSAQVLLVLSLAASSLFCFQPGGDTHLRHGLFDSWHMGCIPIIYSTAAEQCATIFGGLLFRSVVRMEDVVLIIPREKFIKAPAVTYAHLLHLIEDGTVERMQANIRLMVDLTLMRMDDEIPDAFTLTLGVLRYRQQLRAQGTMPDLPPIVDYFIPQRLRKRRDEIISRRN